MEGFLFKNKYKTKSARKNGYNYSGAGFYFVTICSKNKIKLFGNIVNEKMILSEYGKIVEQEWLKTFKIRKNLKIDEFAVMPNHFHGIILIKNQKINEIKNIQYKNKFGPQSENLSAIVRGFKGAVTRLINQKTNSNNIIWQSRFYDRIIRNDNELNKIRQYIIDNPLKWDVDRNNPEYKF
jgi:REP element-mobilizing transposase RayT